MSDIVCISHLRWDFVWQRPQHLLSRLAAQHRVLFVEEPVTETGPFEPRLECVEAENAPGVTVVRLVMPADRPGWLGHGEKPTQAIYEKLLKDYLRQEGYRDIILWLYTPMGGEFIEALPHQLLVYDVMDELSAFAGAPRELAGREKSVLNRADLVFTGGASLYRARQQANPAVYLFPSGVDIEHFAQAARPADCPLPADLEGLKHPVLGYYGVIDERMDMSLLGEVARARPEWSIVLLGPLAKIRREDVPAAPNLRLLGKKSYNDLPAYLAHFDVALVPFALNETTRFLSPTKTLEYMAAHKPVVATPLNDIVELYGAVVKTGRTPAEFIAQVEAALRENPAARRPAEDELLAKHSWDSIVASMAELMDQKLASNPAIGRAS